MLWLCGITQNATNDIRELLEPLQEFIDACQLNVFFILGDECDPSRYLLPLYHVRKWTGDHDIQMTEILRQGPNYGMKEGDWILLRDSRERVSAEFISLLNNNILEMFKQNNIHSVFQRSKLVLFQYFRDQMFHGNPHFGLVGAREQKYDITSIGGYKEDFLTSVRNKDENEIVNSFKYYMYDRTNHVDGIYYAVHHGRGVKELVEQRQLWRLQFLELCDELQLKYSDFEELFSGTEWRMKYPRLAEFIDREEICANYAALCGGVPAEQISTIFKRQKEGKAAPWQR
jgi:hypothetical protein